VKSRARPSAWALLDRPVVWNLNRIALDLVWGLYRRRLQVMRDWGILAGGPTVLDIGCGIGQYAAITSEAYLGVDLNPRYIEYATRRHRRQQQVAFRAADANDLRREPGRFDLVLMVDFLHHLPTERCAALLETAAELSRRYVVSFEPVAEQRNPLGQWIIDHDRGDHMRSNDALAELFAHAPLNVRENRELQLGAITTRAVLCRSDAAEPARS
jgi:SAM-dependent methyltransferase